MIWLIIVEDIEGIGIIEDVRFQVLGVVIID